MLTVDRCLAKDTPLEWRRGKDSDAVSSDPPPSATKGRGRGRGRGKGRGRHSSGEEPTPEMAPSTAVPTSTNSSFLSNLVRLGLGYVIVVVGVQ